ncbi:MAG: YjjG family noncanonical pyrimidine nucleotidase [Lachnospiraceae bacterium]|nr:YjjG family noncanonical pyrimidine nucleotidase [Lachnospiraceae bacterium]
MHNNLLLDLDQTLLDFHASEYIALGKVLQENGLSYSDEIYVLFKAYNKSLWGELEKGNITRTELFTLRFNYIFGKCEGDSTGIDPLKINSDFIRTMSENGVLLEGALEFLQRVKNEIENVRIYIITNGATINAKGRIASTGLDKYIDSLFVSEDMGVNKPSAEFFDMVLKKIEEPKENCIIIGDSLSSDMLGAKNASMTSVWFRPEGDMEKEINAYDIDYTASSYDELFRVIKDWTSFKKNRNKNKNGSL